MRIAVIGTRGVAGPARDGVEKALSELWPRLARRGHDIDVFSERNGHGLAAGDGLRVIRLPSLRWGQSNAHAALSALVSACRPYDVVNFVAAEPGGMFSRVARLGLYRTVVSIHGGPPDAAERPRPEGSAARFADVITVSSRRLERLFRDTYGREAIYIPNGIAAPAQRCDPGLITKLGLVPQGYLLLADRLTAASAAHLAVSAVNTVCTAMPLVVAETGPGDENYRRELMAAASPGRVIFLGTPDLPVLDALFAHTYLYLLPSQAEDTPAGLTIALSHGQAVVISDLPDHLDLVGADGFSFTAGDVGDLRRVLAWLLADEDVVARMRVRVTATVAARYCWDRIADAYEQIYQALL